MRAADRPGRAAGALPVGADVNQPAARSLVEMRDNPRQRQRRKYANEITVVDGITFDSRAEANRWVELRWMEDEGRITGLQRQVPFELVPACKRPSGGEEKAVTYIADFLYYRDRRTIVEDVKGASPDVWILKRKLMLWRHGIEVLETKA